MANYALFDIETTIDWKLIEEVEDCGKHEFLEVLRSEQKRGVLEDVFVPYTYHTPAAIGVGLVGDDGTLEHLGCVRGDDSEAITREFWKWLQGFQSPPKQGILVSFNGRGFDLPVMELAALRYGIRISRHLAEKYGARYRYQDDWHLDIMDYVTNYGATRLRGGLKLLSVMLGMPASQIVHSNLENVPLERMQRWCRNDVRRLYVVFEHLQFIRGRTELPPKLQLPQLEDER